MQPKKRGRKPKNKIIINENPVLNIIQVFTDGSCPNNGKKNAIAGIGIYFGENDPKNKSERIQGKQTNKCTPSKLIFHESAYNIICCRKTVFPIPHEDIFLYTQILFYTFTPI